MMKFRIAFMVVAMMVMVIPFSTNSVSAWIPHAIITDYLKWNDAMCGDINQDGYIDIVAASYDSPQVVWFDGSTSWTSIITIDQGNGRPWTVDICDINDDGYPDIISGWDDEHIRVYSGADFSKLLDIEFEDGRHIHSGDFNNDGRIDIASTSQHASSNQVVWFRNPDWNMNVIDSNYPDNDPLEVTYLYQDDTIPTLISGRYPWGIGEVAFWRNIGGEWNKTVLTDNYNGPRDIRAEDIDMDGDTDILVAGRWAGVSYWINEGNGEFSAENVIESENGGCVAAIPNISGTCMDIIVGFDDTDSEQDIRLYYGPDYNEYLLLGTAGDWDRAHVYDMDNDGDLDILGVSHHGRAMYWYESEYSTGISNQRTNPCTFEVDLVSPCYGRSVDLYLHGNWQDAVSITIFDLTGRILYESDITHQSIKVAVNHIGQVLVKITTTDDMFFYQTMVLD